MALFKSGNPTLTEKIFDKSLHETAGSFGVMSIRGTIQKFGFLLLMVIAAAMYEWNLFAQGNTNSATTYMLVGAIGGFVIALVMMFKPQWAGYIAPAYGILEGLFIGGISAFFNAMLDRKSTRLNSSHEWISRMPSSA